MDREHEICVSSELANLGQIAQFVTEWAQLVGLDEDQAFYIQMAVDEACTNAMQHAYGGRQDGQIRVCCCVEEGDFVVRVTDFGNAFDMSAVRPPDLSIPLEQREIGGLGIFFMHKLMDSVEYHPSRESGNEIIMRKRFRPS